MGLSNEGTLISLGNANTDPGTTREGGVSDGLTGTAVPPATLFGRDPGSAWQVTGAVFLAGGGMLVGTYRGGPITRTWYLLGAVGTVVSSITDDLTAPVDASQFVYQP